MSYLIIAIKLVVGFSILTVWLLRSKKSTPFRGGEAKSLKEEFETYGLNTNIMYLVGAVKITLSILLMVSVLVPVLEPYAAWGLTAMMVAAVGFHFKVGDPLVKAFPAALFLTLSVLAAVL